MNEVQELSVDELSSSTEETSKSLEISISKIATTIKLAMGIVTIGDIFPNLAGTIKLVCHSCDNQNSFSKLKLTNDKKTLIGVMFIGRSQLIENDCFFVKSRLYKSVLKYKIFSIQIENESQRELITGEFNKWFKQFASSINIQFKMFNKERKEQQQLSCCFPKKQKKMVCIANAPRMPDALELSMMSKSASEFIPRERTTITRWLEAGGTLTHSAHAPPYSPYSSDSSLAEPVSPISTHSVNVGGTYSSPSPDATLGKEERDALYYHPNQIMRKKVSNSRLSVQSPLVCEHHLVLCETNENKIIESELIENKSNTLNKFDMCKNLIKDDSKKTKQEKKQMHKLIKELDNTNCKSYMLRVPKPLLAIKGPTTPTPPPSPPTPIVRKNNIMATITEV